MRLAVYDDLPEELEQVVMTTMQKDRSKRQPTGNAMAAELTRVYKDLRQKYDSLDNQEHFDLLRTLTFFHEFSHAEIWEVLRASDWHEYKDGDDIVRGSPMLLLGQAQSQQPDTGTERPTAGKQCTDSEPCNTVPNPHWSRLRRKEPVGENDQKRRCGSDCGCRDQPPDQDDFHLQLERLCGD